MTASIQAVATNICVGVKTPSTYSGNDDMHHSPQRFATVKQQLVCTDY